MIPKFSLFLLSPHAISPSRSISLSEPIELDSNRVYSLGRSLQCSISLDSPGFPNFLSRSHGRLEYFSDSAQWRLTDLSSLNGIFLNNQRISSALLKSGDIFTLGATRKFEVGEFAPAEALDAGIKLKISSEEISENFKSKEEIFSSIKESLTCVFCQELIFECASIVCSHSFCLGCLFDWLHRGNFACPLCRQPIDAEPVQSRAIDSSVEKILNNEEIIERNERKRKREIQQKKSIKMVKKASIAADLAIRSGREKLKIDQIWDEEERKKFRLAFEASPDQVWRDWLSEFVNFSTDFIESAGLEALEIAARNLEISFDSSNFDNSSLIYQKSKNLKKILWRIRKLGCWNSESKKIIDLI